MRVRPVFLALAGLSVLALAAGAPRLRAGWTGADRFPHEEHAALFPLCTGCHAGAAGGKDAAMFPTKETCANCHDGKTLRTVDWSAPHGKGSNLRFTHAEHVANAADAGEKVECASCHTAAGATTTVKQAMGQVTRARPEFCIKCHAHQVPTHLAEKAECRSCHVSLAKAEQLDSARIAALPKPDGHDAPDFLLKHGPTVGTARARCATCHTRESCQRCHLNAASVPAIAALESSPRVGLVLARKAARYPTPASHGNGWDARHGAAARAGAATCANCHAQASCRTCHIGDAGREQIAALPVPAPGGPQGVMVQGAARPTVEVKAAPGGRGAISALNFTPPRKTRAHPQGFIASHGPAAASGSASCTACHAQSFCSSCHAGSSKPVFHPANFIARHAADAYGGARNCGSCHNTESFCKTCHQGAGLASQGRVDVAFHTGQPFWLLQHGEAARKGLEGCTSCHKQRDCTRCHSAAGGWGVNPHGPNFDANRAADRNQLVCARCHTSIPGRNP